jgi:DNA-binding response OmpR family regulator
MDKKILLVEDEIDLLDIMSESLCKLGYSTNCFTDPSHTISKFYEHSDEFSCAIIDYNMPNFNGVELCLQLFEISPHLPVILTTGFADENIRYLLSSYKNVYLLEKPFRLDELAFLVHQLVNVPSFKDLT